MTIQQLLDARASALTVMREVNDSAKAENRDFTAEETEKYSRAESEFDSLTERIEREKNLEERSRALATIDAPHPVVTPPAERDEEADRDEYRKAFASYVIRGMMELEPEQRSRLRAGWRGETEARAQGVGTASAGGYLVPEGYQAEIIRVMKDFGAVINVARVLTTDTGNELPWPTVDDTAQVGALLAENTQVAEQDVTLGTKQLDAYKYTSKLVRVSWELLQDSAFDVEDLLRDLLGERVGRIQNQHFTTGTGTAQPNGIVTGATSGVTAAGVAAITGDELISLVHSVDRAYRFSPRARFMMSDAALASIRKLKDSDGQYLWVPGLRAGETDTLLGFPVEINTDMAVPATGVKSVLFGDFFAGYVVRLVRGFQLIRLDERYADYFQSGFVGFSRADGEVVNTAAYKALTQA